MMAPRFLAISIDQYDWTPGNLFNVPHDGERISMVQLRLGGCRIEARLDQIVHEPATSLTCRTGSSGLPGALREIVTVQLFFFVVGALFVVGKVTPFPQASPVSKPNAAKATTRINFCIRTSLDQTD
jgi:hypothetical protein